MDTRILGARFSLAPVLGAIQFGFATDEQRRKMERQLGGLRHVERMPEKPKPVVPEPAPAAKAPPAAAEPAPVRDPAQGFLPGIEPEQPELPDSASEEDRFVHLMNKHLPEGHEAFTPEEIKEFLTKRKAKAPRPLGQKAKQAQELQALGEMLQRNDVNPHEMEYPKRAPGYEPDLYARRSKMLQMQQQGRNPRHIANALGLDEKTVRKYLEEAPLPQTALMSILGARFSLGPVLGLQPKSTSSVPEDIQISMKLLGWA